MKEDWITATPTIQHFMFRVFQIELHDLNYRKVASSRPVYYSILELLDQRSQYTLVGLSTNPAPFIINKNFRFRV